MSPLMQVYLKIKLGKRKGGKGREGLSEKGGKGKKGMSEKAIREVREGRSERGKGGRE